MTREDKDVSDEDRTEEVSGIGEMVLCGNNNAETLSCHKKEKYRTRMTNKSKQNQLVVKDENVNESLLSSFNEVQENSSINEDEDLRDKSSDSDDRLIYDEEQMVGDQELANIQESVFASSSSDSQQTESQNNTLDPQNSVKNNFNLNSIKNNFNFLDKLFKSSHIYSKLPGSIASGPNDNDGVFNNLSAKPDTQSTVDSDKPPTYEEAAADATPPYWESSVLASGFADEIFVDGLPVGNIVNFLWNLMVSASFQFVGFLLTYILHTSHAAKQGSRAGLGITFISYGYYMIPYSASFLGEVGETDKVEPTNPNEYASVGTDYQVEGTIDTFHSDLKSGVEKTTEVEGGASAHANLIAYVVIAFGAFVFIKALINYHRAKQMEKVILQPPANMPVVEEV